MSNHTVEDAREIAILSGEPNPQSAPNSEVHGPGQEIDMNVGTDMSITTTSTWAWLADRRDKVHRSRSYRWHKAWVGRTTRQDAWVPTPISTAQIPTPHRGKGTDRSTDRLVGAKRQELLGSCFYSKLCAQVSVSQPQAKELDLLGVLPRDLVHCEATSPARLLPGII